MSYSERCIILGAGAPHKGKQPALLEQVDGICVFDWLLNALSMYEEQIDLVLGYQSADIAHRYSQIRTIENPHWQTTGSAASLLQADLRGVNDLLVCYGDILIRSKLVDELRQIESPIAVAWDSQWKQRYVDRAQSDIDSSEKILVHAQQIQRLGNDIPVTWAHGEFIGLVRLSGPALDLLRELQKNTPETLWNLHLSGLIEWLRISGVPVSGCDVAGDWAEVNQPKDIAHFVLGTKAETLSRLRSIISSAVIQDQVSFTISEWQQSHSKITQIVREKFSDKTVVVRSSARSEDSFTYSNAGAYTSLLNVDVWADLEGAVETVIGSYHNILLDDQVLIQPMVQNVVMSGVAFTRTLERGAPWVVINYEVSESTNGITGGYNNDHHTLYVRKDAQFEQVADPRLVPLIRALEEIEHLLAYDALDVEFAIDKDGQVHVLQVRPITMAQIGNKEKFEAICSVMKHAEQRWLSLCNPAPHLLGEHTIYGVMPDWNPAEIIGTHPGRLAESLYRHLILNETWATQRAEYGYRDVRPQPLLVNFAGTPYIDVRASFNSFVPANVPDPLAARLIDFYLDWLRRYPYLHDKVEFEVVPTCLGLDFERWRQRLKQYAGLSNEELDCLQDGLRQITANAIERTSRDFARLDNLEQRFSASVSQPLLEPLDQLRYVKEVIEDCRLLGALTFAHLARSSFIAVTLLKEAVVTGVISEKARDAFMASIRTVSHELSEDASATANGSVKWTDFVDKYGHLRPGTYDLVSLTYRDDPEKYLRPLLVESHEHQQKDDACWQNEKTAFFRAIRLEGLNYDDIQFEEFLRNAIEGREKAKFIFTRSLSSALDMLVLWGEQYELDRHTLAHLSLEDLFSLINGIAPLNEQISHLRTASTRAASLREVSLACELPALITQRDDFYSFILQGGEPNFIGGRQVIADCINLGGVDSNEKLDMDGCIVMVPQADPGYDWLFSQGIVGLVTMYGGANSHMAIRAAEFGLPAAIGIGEQLYRQLMQAQVLELDPTNARLKKIR